ncbi:type II secretion system protein, partial [bacterium]|nr:type II secretion system protein [bacterium]
MNIFEEQRVSSRVDFSLPEKLDCRASLAMTKVAFTLAEVLITLGIIGIVAAMTLPTLIAKYEKKQTAVRLKQTYAQLQQAIQMSVAENGDIAEWNWPQENWFDTYIVKYLKLAKNKGEFKVFDSDNQEEIDAGDYIPYKQINGEQETGLAILRKGFSGSRNYILANGVELITYNDVSSLGTDIIVDLNTSSRKPNQF